MTFHAAALRIAGFALAAMVLAGCETTLGPPETLSTRSAIRYGTVVAVENGSSQGVPCGLDRSPLIDISIGSDAAVAGYSNTRAEGGLYRDDPLACDRWQVRNYTGAFLFDLSDLPNAVIVDSATVTFDQGPTTLSWREVAECEIQLLAAAEDWAAGETRGGPGATIRTRGGPYRRSMVGTTDGRMVAGRTFMSATGIVTGWLTNREPNFGFVFKQTRPGGGGPDRARNDTCTARFSNARLDITIRRFVPRSP